MNKIIFVGTDKGGHNLQNYRYLIKEKLETTINSINSEIKNFPIDEIRSEQNI